MTKPQIETDVIDSSNEWSYRSNMTVKEMIHHVSSILGEEYVHHLKNNNKLAQGSDNINNKVAMSDMEPFQGEK